MTIQQNISQASMSISNSYRSHYYGLSNGSSSSSGAVRKSENDIKW